MPFLEILLPTGHREKIEVNTNMILISVLEDVCIKRGLIADNCYLMFNKNKMDLSQKFGMSRLLNNAKLDLIETEMSIIEKSTIDVALQLPNGSRINSLFCPKESLYSVMERFVKSDLELETVIFPKTELVPVIIHLHDQIVGVFGLKNTTLASMGLRTGRVLFRLEFKQINEDEQSKMNEIINLRKEKLRLGEISRKNKEKMKMSETEVNTVDSTIPLQKFKMKNSPPTTAAFIAPDDFVPFSAFSSTNRSMFDHEPQKQQSARQREPQTLGEILGINLDHDSQPENDDSGNVHSFLDFKFPDLPINNNTEDDEKNDKPKRIVTIEDRESVLYQHNPSKFATNIEDIPETFFDLTEHDLRSIIQSYRSVAESDNPLMTNALREQMREKRFAKYKRCIIQFQFQDSYILQSVFTPQETVDDLYNFIRQFFRNKSLNFNLFTTPPKEILKNKEKNLIQSDLVPMSKVYVSVSGKDLSSNIDQLLSGDELVAKQVIEKWMSIDHKDQPNYGGTSSNRHENGNSGNARKMPKWFKSGK